MRISATASKKRAGERGGMLRSLLHGRAKEKKPHVSRMNIRFGEKYTISGPEHRSTRGEGSTTLHGGEGSCVPAAHRLKKRKGEGETRNASRRRYRMNLSVTTIQA